MKLKAAVHMVLAASAFAAAMPAMADEAQPEVVVLEEILVTAQKRVENVQAVPIAVTALTPDAMQAQQINFGADLQRSVPNMNFSRLLAGETNFQIRGIGYQLVATAGDAGVGLHSNNVPLSVSRIADVDFYDLERIEVLRGPQGTLYGRNATGGVINLITAKPTLSVFSGSGTLEYGSYDSKKFNGHVNLPMGDMFALRLAGLWQNRDGYTDNLATGEAIDGRDLWSGRASLLFSPSDTFSATFRFERFDENDDRNGGAREMCIKDPGPTSVGGVATDGGGNAARATQNLLSRGCLPGSVYSSAAYGTVNYVATLAGQLGNLSGLLNGDAYSGVTQSANLREVSIAPMANHKVPQYTVLNDLYEMNLEWKITDGLKLTSLTAYVEDELTTINSASAYNSTAVFNNVAGLAPGGVYNDPQIGPSSSPRAVDIQHNIAKQRSSELRLQSSFTGPLNFNVGGIYFDLEKINDRFIAPNTQNYYVQLANILNNTPTPAGSCVTADCYLDTSVFPDGTGHNYFVSHVPYKLAASALFGELYWDVVDTLRLTTGLRYTDDKKNIDLYPSNMLQPGQGATPNGLIEQEARWKETTGRVNLDWHPTDNSLLYVSYSKGYKGGGINNPNANDTSPAYDPEFVNAYEIGSKNTLADGRLMLNATAFMYDYDGYQISQLRGLVSATENIDAEVKGAELELLWKPVERLRMNATLGYLNTKIKSGTSIDTFDRIQGQAGVTLVKATNDTCLASTAQVAGLIGAINAGLAPTRALLGICAGGVASVTPLPSNSVDLAGKELPQSPDFTGSAGAEYAIPLAGSWDMTVRGDYYYQTAAFTRVYNTESDELQAWSNVNASLTFASKDSGLAVQLYGKNLADKDVISGYTSNSDQLGLTRGITMLDPALYGVNVTYSFGK